MTSVSERAPISGLVPMIHVADVERSAEFYRLLGFEIGNYVPRAGPMHWAWLYAPKAADCRSSSAKLIDLPMQVKAGRPAYCLQVPTRKSPIEPVGIGISWGMPGG